ncbi:hypothetical protein CCR97_00955 [Rhodoplanes elegans]|nr:hypothetical protein [Rhodoplanes elegans]
MRLDPRPLGIAQPVKLLAHQGLRARPASSRRSRSTVPKSRPTALRRAEKGGLQAGDRPLARRTDNENPRPDRSLRPAARSVALVWQHQRHRLCTDANRQSGADHRPHRGQGLRRQQSATSARRGRRQGRDPVDHQPQAADPLDRIAYRRRNRIERMFSRLKDFRRVATRYDKLARNFLAGAILAATVAWWLN